ncbi:hypothetical protein WJX77_009084 [Trebouxia sp. C0004]
MGGMDCTGVTPTFEFRSMGLEHEQGLPGLVRPGVATDLRSADNHPQLHNQVDLVMVRCGTVLSRRALHMWPSRGGRC